MPQVGVHFHPLEEEHAILIPVSTQFESWRIRAVLGQHKPIKRVKLAVCQNEIDIPSNRRGAIVRCHGMHVHIENHGFHFSCLGMQQSAPEKLTADVCSWRLLASAL